MKKLLLLALLFTSCAHNHKAYEDFLKSEGGSPAEVKAFLECWSMLEDKYKCEDKATLKEAFGTCIEKAKNKEEVFYAFFDCAAAKLEVDAE